MVISEIQMNLRNNTMIDQYGRNIQYLRISLTDRCNLRCSYCMPEGIQCISHNEILTFEEILTVVRAALTLGITDFKITGGEPLVRKGALNLIRDIKRESGVRSVTLTTNGVALKNVLPDLKEIGIDAINISLDTTDPVQYQTITKRNELDTVMEAIHECASIGIRTKINSVLLEETKSQILPLADFAKREEIDVRFIELMPIGIGKNGGGISQHDARQILLTEYPDLTPIDAMPEAYVGNGPAKYERSNALKGRIGWIDAISHKFCDNCNRMRLTSDGLLKPCLCFGEGADLKAALRNNGTIEEIANLMQQAIYQKPVSHLFDQKQLISEQRRMAQIGG